MKISCTQENLNKGLILVSHIASKDVNLPILNNVLFKTENKTLKICATNLEIGITSLVRGRVDEEGEFTTPAKILSDYISFLPKENIEMELKDTVLKLSCGNYNTQIKGNNASEFPVIPTIEKNNGYKLNLTKFKESLQRVAFAAVFSDLRPEISGVLFSFNENKLTLVATDSYRLAENSLDFKFLTENTVQKELSVVVPLRTTQEILRILNIDSDILIDKNEENNTFNLYIDDNQILLNINNTELVSKLTEGQYPDYKQIIPQDFKTSIVINKTELQQAIKSTSLFTKSGVYDILFKINVKAEEVEVFAENSQVGQSSIKIKTQISGENNEIVLNFKYLLEGLQNIDTNQIVIDIVDNTVPCVIRPYNNESVSKDYLYLIMPIRQ